MGVSTRKICTKCKISKPKFLYCKSAKAKDGLSSWCKDCRTDTQRERRQANPGIRRREILARYGITPEEYDAMYDAQGGACLICELVKVLVIDHCHTTGRVRGLFCNNCNVAMGHLGDSDDLIPVLQAYFRSKRATLVG